MLVALMNKKSSYQLIKEVMKNLDKMELEETANIPVVIYVLSLAGINFVKVYIEIKN